MSILKYKIKTKHFPKQREVIESIINDNYKYYCLNIGRGGGKSTILEDVALYYCMKGRKVLFLSKTTEQVRDNNFLPFKARVEHQPFIEDINITYREFRFTSGGYIKFKSGHKPDSLRGANKYNVIIVDEFAFCHNDLWRELLQLSKFEADGVYQKEKMTEKVVLASTPNGYNNFYKAYIAEETDSEWKSFTYTSASNPLVDKAKIAVDRAKVPEIVARQEYDAEFLESGLSAFSEVSLFTTLNRIGYSNSKRYVAGLDIGLVNDFTVLSIFDTEGNMVDYLRFNQCSTDVWVDKLTNKIKEYKISYIVAECNYESTLIKLLRTKSSCQIEEFRTGVNKNSIVEDLIVKLDSKSVKLLNDDLLRSEFSKFVQKKTSTGYNYSAIAGNDDIVMSVVMANIALNKGRYNVKIY
jgi:hypothetical protein